MKYSISNTLNGCIQGNFTSTFHIRKQHPGRNPELPVSPIKALAQVLPCMCHVSYYKNKTLGSVQEHTSFTIAHDTSGPKRKKYAFVKSSLKLMPRLDFACSVCMPSRYTCIFCLLLTLYFCFLRIITTPWDGATSQRSMDREMLRARRVAAGTAKAAQLLHHLQASRETIPRAWSTHVTAVSKCPAACTEIA